MTPLSLVEVPVRMREFTQWALECKWLDVPPGDGSGRPREPEPGYAFHAALAGLFGDRALRPFSILPSGSITARRRYRTGRGALHPLMGYSSRDRGELEALMRCAPLEIQALFDLEGLRVAPLPVRWPKGLRLAFDLRACPIRRRMRNRPFVANRANPRRRSIAYRGGREVDAFQLAAVRAEEDGVPVPRRDDVYTRWLEERFAAHDGNAPPFRVVDGSIRVHSFRSVRLLRRPRTSRGRQNHWLTRPEVWFTGELVVSDGAGVESFLTSGVGRHSGFGFGMLLLRPA